ncbi:RING-box protein 1a [Zea mays]|uniref:RING-box protein 1a n=1 Tax=Zea mays TaxID=4577 RepID=A0A1D6FCR5_MAIZE|nr:RING-box protein 1a [Zea mays]
MESFDDTLDVSVPADVYRIISGLRQLQAHNSICSRALHALFVLCSWQPLVCSLNGPLEQWTVNFSSCCGVDCRKS